MHTGFALIIPAAGASRRFGSNKLGATLAGRPVIVHVVEAFARMTSCTARILLATPADDADAERLLREACASFGQLVTSVRGGATRAHSVLNALRAVDVSTDWVAVHDAARPLVSPALVGRVFDAARTHGAAAPAMPVSLTIKQAVGPLPAAVERTVPRSDLWAMQTPQIMRRADLLDAYERCPIPLDGVTDDVQLLELVGRRVMLVEGEERNLKLTMPLDLSLAELILRQDATAPAGDR